MASKRSRQAFEVDLQKHESPYVFYGTPLPPLDEKSRDDGSYVPVWQQEVTDDRGRKRLHGAFTGGFSAGYYNTVGSKEGWTPSTFVSSRSNRVKDSTKAKEQRPEDFMDEEDLREAEEARTLSTADAFSGFGTEHDPKHRERFMGIFRPSGETIGVKLLKKMGWKEGQGIGPRVRRKAKIDDQGTESNEMHLFAPDDPPMISFNRKSDFKGVGYDGEIGLQAAGSAKRSHNEPDLEEEQEEEQTSHGSGAIPKRTKKTGFGIGILNDTGSDDEDPYEMGPKISYSKVLGGEKKSRKKQGSTSTNANPLLKTKPVFMSKKILGSKGLSGFRKCYDGRLPLDGFILSTELDAFSSMSLNEEDFKPLEVPVDWKSSKNSDTNREDTSYLSTRDAAKTSTLDAQSRAAILGESQLPGKSVFDFLSPAARDKLALASGKSNLPSGRSENLPSQDLDEQSQIPLLDPITALQALKRGNTGFMPYSEDEAKRARYRSFLEVSAGLQSDKTVPPRPQNMTPSDYANELTEFARAAEVFKPVTGLMASRFTSSTSHQQQTSGNAELLSKPQKQPEDPAVEAARMGMFGPGLTRFVEPWHPTRLLCRRFNVPVPDSVAPDDQQDARSGNKATTSTAGRFQSAGYQTSETREPAVKMAGAELPTTVQPKPADAVDPERNEALEKERPGQAFFKAIFGSDDEDDD